MTDPLEHTTGASPAMTPERWRLVDNLLRAALSCEADERDEFVRDACGTDDALRREVASLLAAHDRMTGDFLERPVSDALPIVAERASRSVEILGAALAGRYEIERDVGHGGMATVHLARDLRHDRRVAIKVMRDEVAGLLGVERFLEEIRVTASLQHPHILPLFDSGMSNGLLWYVMPFVEGETLRSRITREGRLPVEEAVRLAREMADALDHAHARGIVHRDVKPENVLLQGGHALVADFGIALALEHAGGERLTRTGLTLGTPQYMAPEQAAGERTLDARVDVYALGAVLHEMLVGEPPFAAPSRQASLQKILSEPPAAIATRRPDVAPWLDEAVRRALAKRADLRFPSAGAFAAALFGVPQRAELAPNTEAAREGPRVVRARVAVYGAIAGVLLGLLGGWAISRSSSEGQSPNAAPVVTQGSNDGVSASLGNRRAAARSTPADGLSLVVTNRNGEVERTIEANRPWTPRFSPDGRHIAYGAFGSGRTTSDIWVTDLESGATKRLTDDDRDSNDPQWSPDGMVIAYSVGAPGGKDIEVQTLANGAAHLLAARPGTQFPSDWPRDGKALVVTEEAGASHDIIMQPVDGSAARPYAATGADELSGRVSRDGRWIAYSSDESGTSEVYVDSYPRPTRRVTISRGGGTQPVWRDDGRELYYWRGDSLIAVELRMSGEGWPSVGTQTSLFSAPHQFNVNTMYDVSPDGQRFVFVRR
jgi:serine/threonine-protein kinase